MKKEKVIYAIISIIAIIAPVGFLLGFIEAPVAFPIIFILLGCQQLYNGLVLASKRNKILRRISLIFGAFFIIFGVAVVFPFYHF